MPKLELWNDYTREDVHSIFSPTTTFTPQAGTWGLQGMVPIPDRSGDWVFFVTFGQAQGNHVFDESITEDGVLSWQSQPKYRLADSVIRQLIQHDATVNDIHLFLRAKPRAPYSYLGTLGYLTHDASRENPVHFQWQLLDWPAPSDFLNRIGLQLALSDQEPIAPAAPGLTVVQPPSPKQNRNGVTTAQFQHTKSPDYAAQDAKNRKLGLEGELLVLTHEKATLIAAGRSDLAEKIVHVSAMEGDSAGYDIRSFRPDGHVRYIEVKTTRGDANTSFYISPNEIAFSAKNASAYSLYRVYKFDSRTNSGQMYILNGDIHARLELIPTSYRAELSGNCVSNLS